MSELKELNRIKLVLVEKKKTGKWLGQQLGVGESSVSRWCSNLTQPHLDTLDKIAEILGVRLRDLIKKD